MFLYLLGCAFLFLSYKSNNALASSLCLIIAFCVVVPCISLIMPSWYGYLMLLLFVGGIFVLVVYIASLSYSKEKFYSVGYAWFFIYVTICFLPYFAVIPYDVVCGVAALFEHEVTWLEFLSLVLLSKTLFFVSYILSRGSAIRKF